MQKYASRNCVRAKRLCRCAGTATNSAGAFIRIEVTVSLRPSAAPATTCFAAVKSTCDVWEPMPAANATSLLSRWPLLLSYHDAGCR